MNMEIGELSMSLKIWVISPNTFGLKENKLKKTPVWIKGY